MIHHRIPIMDEGGECPNCGGNIDRCECTACERGACDHPSHCDNCSRGLPTDEGGFCMECEIHWLAKRQLSDRTKPEPFPSLLQSAEDERRNQLNERTKQ